MISKAQAKRKQDIKTKLMAAIAMLLVSSIMMVSSTYAWFTLSTAPEVTGISTAVGANGNLEMALLPRSGFTAEITSGESDGTKAPDERNRTWGNLVDVSDAGIYGLDKITLNPSKLNAENGVIGAAMLQTPAYGADGRISELKEETVTSSYDSAKEGFYPNGDFGVRAVGVSSGMTDRELDYRNARTSANTAIAQAKTNATRSLTENGNALASIAVQYALKGESGTYTEEHVEALKDIVNDISDVFVNIETAYMQYILAYAASGANDVEAAWTTVRSLVNAEGATLGTVLDGIPSGITLPAAFTTAVEAYRGTDGTGGMIGKVDSARNALNSLGVKTEGYAWSDIVSAMSHLIEINNLTINNIPVSEVTNHLGELLGSEIVVRIPTGGGIYADIADQCGDFDASIRIENLSYGGIAISTDARMQTAGIATPYLRVIGTAVETAGAPTATGTESLPLSEMYGYVIDLAFKTNAKDSKLRIQPNAVDRIYSDNSNEQTMGHGASMTFKATTTDFTDDQVRGLMDAIRIVFFTPGDGTADGGTIIATAKLGTPEVEADGLKAEIVLLGEDGNVRAVAEDGSHLDIMTLTQNTATKLSVLVYLDGETITNADVAATAATSMTGSMNLQFASSADLVPMEYAELHTPQGNLGGDDDEEQTTTTVTNLTVNAGDTGVTATAILNGQKVEITLTGYNDQVVTVAFGEGEATDAIVTDGKIIVDAPADFDATTTNVVVNVTAPAAGE